MDCKYKLINTDKRQNFLTQKKEAKMETYRGAKINQKVIAEYTDNSYAGCRTCLKLVDKNFYAAQMQIQGYDHYWSLRLLSANDYLMLYTNY